MNSSKPIILPSSLKSLLSYSQTYTLALLVRNLNTTANGLKLLG